MANHDQCLRNPAPPSDYVGIGKDETLGPLDVYVSGPENATVAIVLITDVFGFQVPQLRNFADYFAAKGFYTVTPDFFHGEPLKHFALGDPDVMTWLDVHAPGKSMDEAEAVIAAIKKKGIKKVVVAGFCWGGKVVATIKGADVAVMLHPSLVTVEEMKAFSIPLAILAAEDDELTPVALVEEYKVVLAKGPVKDKHMVKIYPKVAHGWTIRHNDEYSAAKAMEARKDALAFINKYTDDDHKCCSLQ